MNGIKKAATCEEANGQEKGNEPETLALLARLLVLLIILSFAFFVLTSEAASSIRELFESETINKLATKAGRWGPVLVVGLMAIAVVISPLPSAPIAIAAGAAYGHVWGTVMVVMGAALGAVIAFLIARWMGRNFVHGIVTLPTSLSLQLSQRALMLAVIVARLIPFVSFDAISYAAGLTKLSLFNFSVATILGLIPMSFFLAHIGDRWVEAEGNEIMSWVLAGGLIMLLPAAMYLWKQCRNSRTFDGR